MEVEFRTDGDTFAHTVAVFEDNSTQPALLLIGGPHKRPDLRRLEIFAELVIHSLWFPDGMNTSTIFHGDAKVEFRIRLTMNRILHTKPLLLALARAGLRMEDGIGDLVITWEAAVAWNR